jgi:hypothetical protein
MRTLASCASGLVRRDDLCDEIAVLVNEIGTVQKNGLVIR